VVEPPAPNRAAVGDGSAAMELRAERLARLQAAIGVTFAQPELLLLALIHSSYLNEQDEWDGAPLEDSNERLEFLGDALLGFVTAGYLFDRYTEFSEGELTVSRAALVRTETLAVWARELALDELLYLARGERGEDGSVGVRVLAGAFEALLGALYLDQGLEAARTFLLGLLERDGAGIIRTRQSTNYKGRLQELLQQRAQTTPLYRIVRESGPPHNRHFIIDVVHQGERLGRGSGPSKRIAEQAAARDALEQLGEEGIS
jgi:ribonuclease-3